VNRALVVGVVVALSIAVTTVAAASDFYEPPGEVYRVWLDGREVDLSRSSASDVFPALSPDARRVAFFSDRGGRHHLYLVRVDGRALHTISSALGEAGPLGWSPGSEDLVWSPDGSRIAVAVDGELVLFGPGVTQRVLTRSELLLEPAWSADGRVIAVDVGDYRRPGLRVVSPFGGKGWYVRGRRRGDWTPTGRIAVVRGRRSRIAVYDERGILRMAVLGRAFGWSADGRSLASLVRDRVEVRTDGRLVFRKAIHGLRANGQERVGWIDRRHVWIGNTGAFPDVTRVDVTTGRTSIGPLPHADPTSPDGRLLAFDRSVDERIALFVQRVGAKRARRLTPWRRCPDPLDAGDIQWLPDGRSVVWAFQCQP
jgi:WD40 repeat protein